jgi:bifunctional non-homologous end joining protein LigD
MSPRFVVHEHDASHLHYDFRLEVRGVLRSWAIPKGPSMNPADKRLAVMVEDHPLEYIDFQGSISEGEYGAGRVAIWDSGTYEMAEEREGQIVFSLQGGKLKGKFSLIRLRNSKKGNDWLLIKQKDQYAQPDWTLEKVLTSGK